MHAHAHTHAYTHTLSTHVCWREEEHWTAGLNLKHLYFPGTESSCQVASTRCIAKGQDGRCVESGELLEQAARLDLPDAEVFRTSNGQFPETTKNIELEVNSGGFKDNCNHHKYQIH